MDGFFQIELAKTASASGRAFGIFFWLIRTTMSEVLSLSAARIASRMLWFSTVFQKVAGFHITSFLRTPPDVPPPPPLKPPELPPPPLPPPLPQPPPPDQDPDPRRL